MPNGFADGCAGAADSASSDGGGVSVEHVPIEARLMIDLPFIRAREMDATQLTAEVHKRTENVDLDGAIVRLRAAC